MKREFLLATVTLMAIFLAGPVLRAGEAVSPPPAEGGIPVSDQVAKWTKAIKAATTVEEAQQAYRMASQLDRNDPAMLNAFMRKMLSLGMPDAALSAAIILNGVEAENALAWSVTGYVYAKRGEYARGLVADVKSEKAAPDSAVEHNLGQLICWFEHFAKAAEVSSADSDMVKKAKADLSKSDEYNKTYKVINDSYAAIDTKKKDMAKNVQAAEKALKDSQKRVDDINKKGQADNQQITKSNQTIDNLRRQPINTTGNNWGSNRNNNNTNVQRDQQINQEQQQINRLTIEIQTLNKQMADAVKDRNEKQKAVEDAKSAGGPEMAAVLRKMTWQLNMDGKPVPLSSVGSVAATPDATTPTSAPAGDGAGALDPAAAEARAAELLKTAKAYLDNGLKDKAREQLKDVATVYPATAAGQEAQKLLDGAALKAP